MTRRQLLRMAAYSAAGTLGTSATQSLFEEVPPSQSGIVWVHENARSPARHLPEALGPGCAFLDYDGDGWMDILLVNSGTSFFHTPRQPLRHALYRNNRNGTFTDVTAKAGITADLFGMGCAVADYNNDGFPDILLTGFGRNILYRNKGDGTFADVTRNAGLENQGWATSAVWFDSDNNGLLDLFICNFVDYGPKSVTCGDNKLGRNHYCIPRVFQPSASTLYRNNGDGTFSDVTRGTDIETAMGKALGVVATDINNDGRLDLFVGNDTVQNFLFINRQEGKFEEAGLLAEVGLSANGTPRSGMGVDSGDIDGDGWEDLFVANVDQEVFSLYRNNGNEMFSDVAHGHDVGRATLLLSGWGLKFFDWDNDGNVDLFLANGHPDDMISRYSPQVTYAEPLLLFQQQSGKLRNVSAQGGSAFTRTHAARGLAIGDFNNDGKVDVLIGLNGGPPLLLKNNAGGGNHWLGVRLVGTRCNRDAIGARVTWSAGGLRRSRLKVGGGSYLSSHDPRMVLGLGSATTIDYVDVLWPGSDKAERFTGLQIDRYSTITQNSAG
ncbi:MAG TPA: CRTAC1 family protein [Bryobacteraceae bacterium]|nr:CRTAC1 family protein [Bryobacteraceae bacterium]